MQWSKITDAQTPIRPLWGVIECVPQSRLKKKNYYTSVEWLATQLKPPRTLGLTLWK